MIVKYRRTSNIRGNLLGNKIVDQSDDQITYQMICMTTWLIFQRMSVIFRDTFLKQWHIWTHLQHLTGANVTLYRTNIHKIYI